MWFGGGGKGGGVRVHAHKAALPCPLLAMVRPVPAHHNASHNRCTEASHLTVHPPLPATAQPVQADCNPWLQASQRTKHPLQSPGLRLHTAPPRNHEPLPTRTATTVGTEASGTTSAPHASPAVARAAPAYRHARRHQARPQAAVHPRHHQREGRGRRGQRERALAAWGGRVPWCSRKDGVGSTSAGSCRGGSRGGSASSRCGGHTTSTSATASSSSGSITITITATAAFFLTHSCSSSGSSWERSQQHHHHHHGGAIANHS